MSQLALVCEAHGKHKIQTQPIPEPMSGYLQVRVEAAAFAPADYKIYDFDRAGFVKKYPTVLGWDAAGEVTKVSTDVTKFKVGDRVAFVCIMNFDLGVNNGERGAFQQYALANARFTVKIPANVDFDSAASFPMNGTTAAGALYNQLNLKVPEPWLNVDNPYKGQKIVVLGGSSSVGSYVIQFAVLSGMEVVTTSSPAHFDYLKSIGASAVIDRGAPDVAAQILAAVGGPVKYVVDAVSVESTQLLAVKILQPQAGKLVLMLRATPAATAEAETKGVTILGSHGLEGFYFSPAFWEHVENYIASGVIKLNRTTVLNGGLRAWEQAFDILRNGKASGTKLVMRPQETVGDSA